MKLNENPGTELPLAKKSREKMLPHIPKAMTVIKRHKADDLVNMIFGEETDGDLATEG